MELFFFFIFFVSYTCVSVFFCIIFVDFKKKKNTALVREMLRCSDHAYLCIVLNICWLAEACFNVYRFVATTYFSTIIFVCCFCLC